MLKREKKPNFIINKIINIYLTLIPEQGVLIVVILVLLATADTLDCGI